MKTDQEIEQLARNRFKITYPNLIVDEHRWAREKKSVIEQERLIQSELAAAKLEGIKEGMRRAAEIASKENACSCFYIDCPVAKRAKNSILSAIDKQTL